MCRRLSQAIVTAPFLVAILFLCSVVVVGNLEETQNLTTTTNYVLHHLGVPSWWRKEKWEKKMWNKIWTSDWYPAVLCSYYRNHGRQAGCCWKKVLCNLAPIPTKVLRSIEMQLLLLTFWFSSRISYHAILIKYLKFKTLINGSKYIASSTSYFSRLLPHLTTRLLDHQTAPPPHYYYYYAIHPAVIPMSQIQTK